MKAENKIANVLEFYYLTNTLKEKLRKGWLDWNISAERLESISEHTYGTCMLALAIYSEFKEKLSIEIEKVILMLILHEAEEIYIGDITPYDSITEQEKLKKGHEAIQNIFGGLTHGADYRNLVLEFDVCETENAKFAYFCDKMECDLQIKKYTTQGYSNFEDAKDYVKNSDRIKPYKDAGITDVSDIFIISDRKKFNDPIFLEISHYIQANSISQWLL